MPETARAFANMELVQGADYELVVTMDALYSFTSPNTKTYRATIVKDFCGTAFNGETATGKILITQSNEAGVGQITLAGSGGATPTITVKVYGIKTEDLDDDFEGFWDLLENDGSTPAVYTRQTEGEVVVRNMATAPF
tara:strand:+ start:956 stop:1369 length:414 start_codon:yes stop_codon:yes gene_type:complete